MQQQLGNVANFSYFDGTSYLYDQSGLSPKVSFNVTALTPNSFRVDLTNPYGFFNSTYATITPIPKHYFEQYTIPTWSSLPYSTASSSYGYTWNATKYGGTGSGISLGPWGNGPYVLSMANPSANTFNETRNPNFWNFTGLTGIGQFSVMNYNIGPVSGAGAAVAAYSTGAVNLLDPAYGLSPYVTSLEQLGANVLEYYNGGYQEVGFNMQSPIWGTGTSTPLGISNSSLAASAAQDVRRAFSYLIPRQQIVSQLLSGIGSPGITPWGPAFGTFYSTSLTADQYDTFLAESYLAAAGYSTGVSALQSTLDQARYSGATGLLRVNSIPAVWTTISVNGTRSDDWAINWVPMPTGYYTLQFADVPNFESPISYDVSFYPFTGGSTGSETLPVGSLIPVYPNTTTLVNLNFQEEGFLRVVTNPPAPGTIYIDGMPKEPWGLWVSVPPGTYNITWGDIPYGVTPRIGLSHGDGRQGDARSGQLPERLHVDAEPPVTFIPGGILHPGGPAASLRATPGGSAARRRGGVEAALRWHRPQVEKAQRVQGPSALAWRRRFMSGRPSKRRAPRPGPIVLQMDMGPRTG